MDEAEFRTFAGMAVDFAARYRAQLRDRPVRARTRPGEIAALLAPSPPETPEPMETILADFERDIVPGMTHWQHPRFFAYFPANAAPVSVIAEILVSAMAAQCMLWQTSPAATEMETVVLDWLRQAVDLPGGFAGVIQDSASSATLAAMLTMREKALGFTGNRRGLAGGPAVRIYCSTEVHSSIDKAAWVSGIGQDNLVKVAGRGPLRGIDVEALDAAILADRDAGRLPAGIVACVGGTSVGACDDVAAVAALARRRGLMLHVDAAWAGSAMICPEFRSIWAGVEHADSVVLNPHKWLGAQFDCAAHFVRNPDDLVRTLAIQPEYLKTHGRNGFVNYSEWSVPLGRRFRALKLWFLMRAHGLSGLREMIRGHVAWAEALCERLRIDPGFEIVTEPVLSLFSFRPIATGGGDADALTLALVEAINDDGRIYLTQTRVDGRLAVRFVVGAFDTTEADVAAAYEVIAEIAARVRV
ncbi:MAG TPA: pyridoxal-dependent decarboxylase [Methylomirabilota bacterium]|nr:pyridoxal-dependent decarboxylase [Methylomirabilota bacterium]